MSVSSLSKDAKKVLESLPVTGRINNETLRTSIGWEDRDRFYEVRSELIDKEYASHIPGGPGGSTKMNVDLSEDGKELLEALPRDGSATNNKSLRRELGWEDEEERFWSAREQLRLFGLADATHGGPGGATYFLISIDDLREDCQTLYAELPDDGDAVPNKALREKIGWEEQEERYWDARDELLKFGFVGKSRGQGGKTYRLVASPEPVEDSDSESLTESERSEVEHEMELYDQLEESLKKWCKDQGYQDRWVENTSHAGRAFTGGKWTRPDLTVIGVWDFQHLPGRSIEVVTFEVKRFRNGENWDIEAVFETLAHARFVHRSFLLVHLPADEEFAYKFAQRLYDECRRHNVGLLTFEEPSDYSTIETVIDPESDLRSEYLLNQFIERQNIRESTYQQMRAHFE